VWQPLNPQKVYGSEGVSDNIGDGYSVRSRTTLFSHTIRDERRFANESIGDSCLANIAAIVLTAGVMASVAMICAIAGIGGDVTFVVAVIVALEIAVIDAFLPDDSWGLIPFDIGAMKGILSRGMLFALVLIMVVGMVLGVISRQEGFQMLGWVIPGALGVAVILLVGVVINAKDVILYSIRTGRPSYVARLVFLALVLAYVVMVWRLASSIFVH